VRRDYVADVTESRPPAERSGITGGLVVVQLTHVCNNWQWLKFRHDSADSRTSLWTHICIFTYAVMSFASTDGADLEEAFSGFAGVADEMYRLTFGGCHMAFI